MASGRKAQNIGHYNNKIVSQLLLDKPYSCIEMSKKIKLTHTATGLIVDRLLNMDLIRVYVENISKRSKGRQHVRYEINPNRAFFVCVNFQNYLESLMVCDICGKILYKENLNSEFVDNLYLYKIIEKINDCINNLNLSLDNLAVVSIAVPGRIDNNTGAVIVSSKISEEVNLKDKFKNSFPNAIIEIKNDIVYACTGSMLSNEFDYGGGSHLFAYFGMGLSCCLIYNRQIIIDSNGFGGEIGMNTIDKDGTRLHEVSSFDGLLNFAKQTLKNNDVTINDIIENSEKNQAIKDKILEIAKVVGVVLRNLVDITGCSHIVFSGIVTNYPKYFFDECYNTLTSSIYSKKINYKIDTSKIESADMGQIYMSRLVALDWVMSQYNN